MLKDVGPWLLILTGILIFGRLWFNLIEWLLSKVKALLGLSGKQDNWHAFNEGADEGL